MESAFLLVVNGRGVACWWCRVKVRVPPRQALEFPGSGARSSPGRRGTVSRGLAAVVGSLRHADYRPGPQGERQNMAPQALAGHSGWVKTVAEARAVRRGEAGEGRVRVGQARCGTARLVRALEPGWGPWVPWPAGCASRRRFGKGEQYSSALANVYPKVHASLNRCTYSHTCGHQPFVECLLGVWTRLSVKGQHWEETNLWVSGVYTLACMSRVGMASPMLGPALLSILFPYSPV